MNFNIFFVHLLFMTMILINESDLILNLQYNVDPNSGNS